MHHKFLIRHAAAGHGTANFTAPAPTVMRSQPAPAGKRESPAADRQPCAGGVCRREFQRQLWRGRPREARADSRFGISKEQGGVQSQSVGNTAVGGPVSPTPAAIRERAGFSGATPGPAPATLDMALFVFLARVWAEPAALLNHQDGRPSGWADPDSPALFSEVARTCSASPLPDIAAKIETDKHPHGPDRCSGVGTQNWPAATRWHHNSHVIDGKTVSPARFNWRSGAAHANVMKRLLVVHSPVLAGPLSPGKWTEVAGRRLGITRADAAKLGSAATEPAAQRKQRACRIALAAT